MVIGELGTAPEERRRFPRLRAPILAADASWFSPRRPVVDASLGGIRIYADDFYKPGRRLDVELLLPPATPVRALARVAWTRELAPNGPAAYEVGLEFISFPSEHCASLLLALEQGDDVDGL